MGEHTGRAALWATAPAPTARGGRRSGGTAAPPPRTQNVARLFVSRLTCEKAAPSVCGDAAAAALLRGAAAADAKK